MIKKKDKIFLGIFLFLFFIAIVTSSTWQNLVENDFNNGTYTNTSYLTDSISLLNGTFEFSDSQIYNITTRVNMTGNIFLLHMNEGTPNELPDSQLDDSAGDTGINMAGNNLLLHMNNAWTDASGLSNDGTAQGGVAFTTDGKLGTYAGSLDGINDYVGCGSSGFPDGAEDRTISIWIKPASISDIWGGIVGYGTKFAGNAYALTWNAGNPTMILGRYSGNADSSSNTNISMGEWSHLVVTLSGGTDVNYYLNGNPDGTASIAGVNTVLSYCEIGRAWESDSQSFNGTIDEVAIWNRTLSATEIKNIYNKQAPLVQDTSGNENNATGQGQVNCSASGKLGSYGCSFDGEGDYISQPTLLDVAPPALTISGWVKKLNGGTAGAWLSKHNIAFEDRIYMYVLDSGLAYAHTEGGNTGNNYMYSTTNFTDELWHQITLTWDTSEGTKLYVDGALEDSNSTATTMMGDGTYADFRIGEHVGSGIYFNGSIDEVAIWNRTLSATEISESYYSQRGQYYPSGQYLSEIKDLSSSQSFNNFSWCSDVGELPDSQATSCDETASMTGNVLLLHMNNAWTDSSGLGNNGAASGVTFTTSSKLGSHAGSFDGISNYVNVSDSDSLDFTTEMTFSAWVKLDSIGTVQRIINKWIGGGDRTFIFESETGSGNYSFWIRTDTTNFNVKTSTGVETGVWHHIAGTKNSSDISIFVDGALQESTALTGNMVANAADLHIGQATDGGAYFNGSLDEVAMWNRSLSATEILDIYQRGAHTLGLSVRSCNDVVCDTEAWNSSNNDWSGESISDLVDNQYFQYKFDFATYSSSYTPFLYNITLDYSSTSDTCTCPSINTSWEINMADACTISTACNLGTGKLSFTGSGSATCNASINTTDLGDPGSSGTLYIGADCNLLVS